MKRRINLIEKYLNTLLVFLIPTQLAIHFWPEFSLLFGIRIDYLAPTIYLTDLLFVTLFVNWSIRNNKVFIKDFIKRKWIIIALLLLIVFNTFFSISPIVSLVKWLKVFEMILFSYYIYKRKDVYSKNAVGKILLISLCIVSLVGITQFLTGKTIGGLFYIFGERTFDIFTPGIALVNLFGNNFLRVYSTFSHPNSLAGFLGLFFVFFYLDNLKINKYSRLFGLLLISITFILTFSLSSFIGILFTLVMLFLLKRNTNFLMLSNLVFYISFLIGLIFLVSSNKLVNLDLNFSSSSIERIRLAEVSGKIISENIFFGTGINTFILSMGNNLTFNNAVWLLQPVHNIFLLLLSELGITGVLLIYVVFCLFLKRTDKHKNINAKWIFLSIFFVLITGSLDHYWLTIQQNIMLLSLIIGISARETS